jgi:hypothetical protein
MSECFLFFGACCLPGLACLTFSNFDCNSSLLKLSGGSYIHCSFADDVHLEGSDSVQNTQSCSSVNTTKDSCHNEYMQKKPFVVRPEIVAKAR